MFLRHTLECRIPVSCGSRSHIISCTKPVGLGRRIMLFFSGAPPMQPGAEIRQPFVSLVSRMAGKTTWTRAIHCEKGSAHSGG
jgi:hypothetical protein